MKAMSPVRSARGCGAALCCVSDRSVAISRGAQHQHPHHHLHHQQQQQHHQQEALRELDMERCYSRLKQLVPSIPADRALSQVEILQHVIDYICDLQGALEDGAELRVMQNSDITHSFSKEDAALCH